MIANRYLSDILPVSRVTTESPGQKPSEAASLGEKLKMVTTIHNDAIIDIHNAIENCRRVIKNAGLLTEDQYGKLRAEETDARLAPEVALADSLLASLYRIEFFLGK